MPGNPIRPSSSFSGISSTMTTSPESLLSVSPKFSQQDMRWPPPAGKYRFHRGFSLPRSARCKSGPREGSSDDQVTTKNPVTRVIGSTDVFARIGRWLGDESGDRSRPVILSAVLTLAGIGLIQVASASSVESVARGLNPYDLPLKQGMWTFVGVLIMFFLARLPPPSHPQGSPGP